MTFSLIVPIYKVAPYIEKCLRSILTQEYTDYEVLLIDDASPDDSIDICRRIVGDDAHFRFFHNEQNIGLSATRNLGLKEARGEWIWFVDSDDYISENALSQLAASLSPKADVICFGVQFLKERNGNTTPMLQLTPHKPRDFSSHSTVDFVLRHDRKHAFSPVWNKVYRREFLVAHNCMFEQTAIEDVFFNLVVFSNTNLIEVLSECLYYYLRRQNGSLSKTHTLETKEVYQRRYHAMLRFLQKKDALQLKNRLIAYYCYLCRLGYVQQIALHNWKEKHFHKSN